MTKNAIILPKNGKIRPVIENLSPEINNGKYPTKSITGRKIYAQADILVDGHDNLGFRLLSRHSSEKQWIESKMYGINEDRYEGFFFFF